jgi:hypothetical protein
VLRNLLLALGCGVIVLVFWLVGGKFLASPADRARGAAEDDVIENSQGVKDVEFDRSSEKVELVYKSAKFSLYNVRGRCEWTTSLGLRVTTGSFSRQVQLDEDGTVWIRGR